MPVGGDRHPQADAIVKIAEESITGPKVLI